MKLGDTVMYKTGCTEYTVVAIEYNSSFVTILSSKSDNSYLAAKSRLVVVKSFLQKGDRMLKFKFKVSQEVMFKAVNVAPVRKSLHEKNTVMVSLQKMS